MAKAAYETKVADGSTVLTRIHHRQTPLLLMQGLGQAGVTWTSEAIFQEQQGHKIDHVVIPAGHNTRAIYSAAMVTGAAHAEATRAWLAFIASDQAFCDLGTVWLPALCKLKSCHAVVTATACGFCRGLSLDGAVCLPVPTVTTAWPAASGPRHSVRSLGAGHRGPAGAGTADLLRAGPSRRAECLERGTRPMPVSLSPMRAWWCSTRWARQV